MHRIAFTFAFSLAAAFAVGCSSTADDAAVADGADQEANGALKILEAKLYDEPNAQVDASCDRYTALTVSKSRSGKLTAKLENKLGGFCEIYVAPNPRSFVVTESESCGSKVYAGANGASSIKVQDNRTRLCEDVRPSVIEVEETTPDGTFAMYGSPLASQGGGTPAPVSKVIDVKLYPEPHTIPSPFCDHYLKLVLGKEGSKLVADLKYELSPTSACEIAVQPDERTYEVHESESCGSKVYEGASGGDSLRVQDNRTRLCEDLRPATVELSEMRGGRAASYYGDF